MYKKRISKDEVGTYRSEPEPVIRIPQDETIPSDAGERDERAKTREAKATQVMMRLRLNRLITNLQYSRLWLNFSMQRFVRMK